MISSLSYKWKCYLLAFAFILFCSVSYLFSYADTLAIMADNSAKDKKLAWFRDKEEELPLLRRKVQEFEKAYARSDSLAVRDKLTAFISDFAEKNQCIVTEIPGNSYYSSDRLKVQTNTFTVKGSFRPLLMLLHKIEHDYRYVSKVMSVSFSLVKSIETRKNELFITMVTQSFEQSKP